MPRITNEEKMFCQASLSEVVPFLWVIWCTRLQVVAEYASDGSGGHCGVFLEDFGTHLAYVASILWRLEGEIEVASGKL
jgi:hypothetical protein